MQLQDLYIKSINRPVNPAVSATKFDKETIDIEIKEYVFTDEILNPSLIHISEPTRP